MKVEFKFEVDQRVATPFDDKGIVVMCAIDDGGTRYFVKTSTGGNWFKETELT